MSWIEVLRAQLLKTQSIEMWSYTSTFPCTSVVCRWTAVPSALPFTHILFYLNAIQNNQLKLQGKARLGKLKWVHLQSTELISSSPSHYHQQ